MPEEERQRRQAEPRGRAVDTLLAGIFAEPEHPLRVPFAGWVTASRRFRDFATTYGSKIRRKVRAAEDGETQRDLQCELEAAFLLLAEPRFAVEYERQPLGNGRAPDFTVTYRSHVRFSIEVKRLRPPRGPEGPPEAELSRIGNAICDKVGQMPPGMMNVLWLATERAGQSLADLASVARQIKTRAERRDESLFVGRGYRDLRDFLQHYHRISAVLLRSSGEAPALWLNKEARHPLAAEVATAVTRCVLQRL